MIIDNKKTFSAIDDTHAELEFVSIDPIAPNVLPIDYEAEFLFKPNRAGINIEYRIKVRTPRVVIDPLPPEVVCTGEEITTAAHFEDAGLNPDNIVFSLFRKIGNNFEEYEAEGAVVEVIGNSKSATFAFPEAGKYRVYASFRTLTDADLANPANIAQADINVYGLSVVGLGVAVQPDEQIDVFANVSGPVGQVLGLAAAMSHISGPQIFRGSFPIFSQVIVSQPGGNGFEERSALFPLTVKSEGELFNEIDPDNPSVPAVYRFQLNIVPCIQDGEFQPPPVQPPPPTPPDLFLNGIIFDWEKTSSINDSIGVRRVRAKGDESLFDIPDTPESPGWSPDNENEGVNAGAGTLQDRNWEFRRITANTSQDAFDVGVGQDNLERYGDSPALYRWGLERFEPGGTHIWVKLRIPDDVRESIPEEDFPLRLLVRAEGTELSVREFAVYFERDGRVTLASGPPAPWEDIGFVPLPLSFTNMPGGIGRHDVEFEWFFREDDGGASTPIKIQVGENEREAVSRHRIYMIPGPQDPVSPWEGDYEIRNMELPVGQQFFGYGYSKPWTEILDYACEIMSGASTHLEALVLLEDYLYNLDITGPARVMETIYKTSSLFFASGTLNGWNGKDINPYSLKGYFERWINPETIQISDPKGNAWATSCFDQAGIFALMARVVGIDAHMNFAEPFADSYRRPITVFGHPNTGMARPEYTGVFGVHAYNSVGESRYIDWNGNEVDPANLNQGQIQALNARVAAKQGVLGIGSGHVFDPLTRYSFAPQQNPPADYRAVAGIPTNEVDFWRYVMDRDGIDVGQQGTEAARDRKRERRLQIALGNIGRTGFGLTSVVIQFEERKEAG
ncbi:MAG: hypothetical protein NUW37_03795 [Planctomycetes bacterium]|nr:hypothetical protein [Planctomycetota bacterium]